MTAAGVIELVQLLADNGIKVHIDGGWGVDGRQVECISAEWMVQFHTGCELDLKITAMYQPCVSDLGLKFRPSIANFEPQ